MNPIDGRQDEPAQAVVKVPPCFGCGGLPHGGSTETIRCLQRSLIIARHEIDQLQRRLRLERDFRR